jgi:hypothetical protein
MFFQGNKDNQPFNGPDRRKSARYDLSEEGKAIVNEVTERIKNHHQDNCIIPAEAHQHIPHAIGAVKSFGDGNISRGIDSGYNTLQEVKEGLEDKKETRKKIRDTIATVITTALIGLIVYGILYYLKTKGG